TKGNSWFIVEEAMIDNKGRTLLFREIPVRGPAKTIAVTLGYGQNISRFLDKNPAWLNTSMSSSDMAQSLLRIEIQASEKDGRRDVGEPITAVTLTAANSFKVESKGTCYEQGHTAL